MRLSILQFKVIERYTLSDTTLNKIRKWFRGEQSHDLYHYDCLMRIDPESLIKLRGIEARKDFIELPNKVRLLVWDIEHDIIKAKTFKLTSENMRKYRPIEIFLIYDRRHGHMNWD